MYPAYATYVHTPTCTKYLPNAAINIPALSYMPVRVLSNSEIIKYNSVYNFEFYEWAPWLEHLQPILPIT